jgi:hypothetical protein
MKVIDLTHVIEPGMPVYPGTEEPQLITANSYEESGFRETLLHMTTHTAPTWTRRRICTQTGRPWTSSQRISSSAKP